MRKATIHSRAIIVFSRRQKIEIYQFQDERYIQVQESQFFPGFDLNAIFSECISDAYQLGAGAIDKLSVSVAAL